MLDTAPGPFRFRVAGSEGIVLIVLLNKPHGVLCQFTDGAGRPTLAGLVPYPGVYPAGRLDHDSEGLLVLTDDGALAHRLTDPRHRHGKTYVVQVEGVADPDALAALRAGPVLKDGSTRPAKVRSLAAAPDWLWPRDPPVRFRKAIATSWLELTIHEGRNRQVRRMTAAVGLPTLRLVRIAVAGYTLGDLQPGSLRVVDATPAPAPAPAPASRSGVRAATRAPAPAAGRARRGRR